MVADDNLSGKPDLTLVDFGRAIDLETINEGKNVIMDAKLSGVLSTELMNVAMKKELPWSFDVDTYGLCTTAHAMLFGSENRMELVQLKRNVIGSTTAKKRWMPATEFPRHVEKKIWGNLFDTLLNVNDGLGSRPKCLRQLRSDIDAYLCEQEANLQYAFERYQEIVRK